MPSRCATKKPPLTEKMIRKRMTFYKKHWAWSTKDWEDVMFSDDLHLQAGDPEVTEGQAVVDDEPL